MLPLPPLNKIAISACLLGCKCRYDGDASKNLERFSGCISFCPEVLGGLGVPRTPCQIDWGNGEDVLMGRAKVVDKNGIDRSKEFIAGAKAALKICLENDIQTVILKEKSPSCGWRKIYNRGELIAGCGVTAALLSDNNITIVSDMEVDR